jgi:hypothetical protein
MHTVCTQMKALLNGRHSSTDRNDGTGIIDGVVQRPTLRIDNTQYLGACQEEIRRQTEMQTEQQLQYFDFIMFCVSDGSTFGLNGSESCFTAYLGNNVSSSNFWNGKMVSSGTTLILVHAPSHTKPPCRTLFFQIQFITAACAGFDYEYA